MRLHMRACSHCCSYPCSLPFSPLLMANNQMLSERMTPGNWGDRYNDLFEADVSVSLCYSGYNQLEVKLFKIGVGGKTFKLFPRLFFGGATF